MVRCQMPEVFVTHDGSQGSSPSFLKCGSIPHPGSGRSEGTVELAAWRNLRKQYGSVAVLMTAAGCHSRQVTGALTPYNSVTPYA